MIKFFRNIRQTLLTERKVTKYLLYAIGEIVLVVIGILIALQINNWNENRKEAAHERKILQELKSDFLYNKEELFRNINKAGVLVSHGDSLLFLFTIPKADVDLGLFSRCTKRLTGYSTFDPSNGALTNLISSGNLNIIKNDSLRMRLSKWSGMLEDVKEDERRLIEFGDAHLDPIRLVYLYPDVSKIDLNRMVDIKFENIVRTMRGRAIYIIENYHVLDLEIDKILEDINGELGRYNG